MRKPNLKLLSSPQLIDRLVAIAVERNAFIAACQSGKANRVSAGSRPIRIELEERGEEALAALRAALPNACPDGKVEISCLLLSLSERDAALAISELESIRENVPGVAAFQAMFHLRQYRKE